MRFFTILITPLILLSSCSIDWNNEKDAKIANLEAQINNTSLDNQEKCAEKAKEVSGGNSTNSGYVATYGNHYNSKLGKCFVLIETSQTLPSGTINNATNLFDAFEMKEYGELLIKFENANQEYITSCWVLDSICKSDDEFRKLLQTYMN